MEERIAIFVDGANMFYAQKASEYYIDYKRVVEFFSKKRSLFKAFFYLGKNSPPAVQDQRFHDYLIYNCGYTVRTKEIKEFYDETGVKKQKCNLDIEIAVEMFKEIEHYDTAILMTGDSDFESVLELLRSRGKKTEVVAAKGMLSRELANVAHKLHYLDELQKHLARKDRKFGEKQ